MLHSRLKANQRPPHPHNPTLITKLSSAACLVPTHGHSGTGQLAAALTGLETPSINSIQKQSSGFGNVSVGTKAQAIVFIVGTARQLGTFMRYHTDGKSNPNEQTRAPPVR